ncbi:alpha/beta hydrolase [Mycolicibacterium vinylchloridicum]|uniref:alpha/beta hydrolase n=1 Tax=Mycolicibacterium vinylchloridicum TaxID=2736928 RepID=UPI0015CC6835|nr:alpha/beta hydrolase [Mycolicibacterium vinylchloridicum]
MIPWKTARWLMQAGPADYLLAMSVASAQLPIVGKHLEPLGAATAMSVWGARQMPELVGAAARSWLAPNAGETRKAQLESTREVAEAGLRGVVAAEDLQIEWPAPEKTPPVLKALEHRKHLYRGSVRYGDHPSQLLDVWRREDLPAEPAPVMVFLPGGAWVHGSRIIQGYALMSHLAAQGWVCLSIDYRVAPHHRWPRHIQDVKAAIAWARANVDRYGGDRNFVAVAGCSAGGHLAALAGLTIDDPEYQAHLPQDSDTAVDAVVGIYGRYDWEDRSTPERTRFVDFLERVVVNKKQSRHGDLFRKASPIARIHPKAPPFLVVHGSGDSVIPVAQAQAFVERLRSVSRSKVGYVELPGAGHGFDMTDGARTGSVATAIGLFLNQIRRDRALMSTKEVI